MIYTEIKGLKISKLTLGTVALGIDYGVFKDQCKPDETERNSILTSAIEAGINTFDTAREYGDAEQLLGKFLPPDKQRNNINLVTKFKINAKSSLNYDDVRTEVYRSVIASLKNLKSEQLPICLFHMVSSLDIHQVLKFLPQVLSELKRDGLIKIGGISVDHPFEIEHCLDHAEIEVVQIPINVFDQRLIQSNLLIRLQKSDKIVFARSVFLKGLLFRPFEELTGNLQQATLYLKKLQEFADRSNMTTIQFAFSYIRDLEGITSIVFGAEKDNQIKDNIKLLNGNKIPPEIREEASLFFQTVPEAILTPRMWSI